MSDTVSILTGGSNSFQTTAEHLNNFATDVMSDGVVGSMTNTAGVAPMTGGLAINWSSGAILAVTAGNIYITATPTGQASQRLRAKIAAQNITVALNSSGGTRFVWVYATISATNANTPAVGGDNVVTITQSVSTSATTDTGAGGTFGSPLAIVTVANGAGSGGTALSNGNIADARLRAGVTIGQSVDGWTNPNEAWTYASATTITVPTDATLKYSVGNKIKLIQSGTIKYFYIIGVAATVLTITGGTDYTLANATITSNYYSRNDSPVGFPAWFNYTPTWTGFSAAPTGAGRFNLIGRCVTFCIQPATGTSNATSMTMTLPITGGASNAAAGLCRVADNGAYQAVAGQYITSTTIATFYKDNAGTTAFTGSGAKVAAGTFIYEV